MHVQQSSLMKGRKKQTYVKASSLTLRGWNVSLGQLNFRATVATIGRRVFSVQWTVSWSSCFLALYSPCLCLWIQFFKNLTKGRKKKTYVKATSLTLRVWNVSLGKLNFRATVPTIGRRVFSTQWTVSWSSCFLAPYSPCLCLWIEFLKKY